jgi:hypothetical protein
MAKPTGGAVSVAQSESRTRSSLLLESIALRHQIVVLKRSRTRRPCFRRFERLFWILLSRWWSDWRNSLVIVQPETVLRWRRNGSSAMWKYGNVATLKTVTEEAPSGTGRRSLRQRQRVPKIPAHGTKNQLRRRLPPLEDCRSGCVLHGLFRLPATPAKVATHPDIRPPQLALEVAANKNPGSLSRSRGLGTRRIFGSLNS